MAEVLAKLTGEETKGLAALGRVAQRIGPRKRSEEFSLKRGASGVAPGEVVMVLLSADGALVGRTRLQRGAPDMRALRALWMGADVAAEQYMTQTTVPAATLSAGEAAMLDATGFVDGAGRTDPLAKARIELEQILRDSVSIEEAARELKVSPGRLRQRLSPSARSLYGVKMGGRAWRLPRFQFARRGRLVRNIEAVLPSLPADAHLLAVCSWFTRPHQDLVVGPAETPVSPIAWLEAGRDPAVVARLAAEV